MELYWLSNVKGSIPYLRLRIYVEIRRDLLPVPGFDETAYQIVPFLAWASIVSTTPQGIQTSHQMVLVGEETGFSSLILSDCSWPESKTRQARNTLKIIGGSMLTEGRFENRSRLFRAVIAGIDTHPL
jgi:hypothetical protein